MTTKGFIVLSAGVLTLILLVFLIVPHESQAVPSYARQVKKPCTACHTMWANLNQYGRQFKVKAYTDINQDWEMINKDNMNLPVIAPFSTRVIYEPLVRDSQEAASSHSDVGQVAIFMASRVFDYGGVFTSAEADGFSNDSGGGTFSIPTVKIAFQYPLGEGNTLGLVTFAGLATSADPFNSLGGRDRDLTYDDGLPFILNTGWTFNFWSGKNQGAVLHGYFLGNRLYAAVGMMRGGATTDSPLIAGTGLSNGDSSDPFDVYSRIAWDQKLSNGAITIGLVNYSGNQRITFGGAPVYDSGVNRTYIDVSLEQNYGEDHMVEVQALWGEGEDKNVNFELGNPSGNRKFDGWYLQADYFYDRTIGVIGSLNYIKYKDVAATDAVPTDKTDQWILGVNYLPWLNTKVALQYSDTKTTNVDGTSVADRISRIILEVLF